MGNATALTLLIFILSTLSLNLLPSHFAVATPVASTSTARPTTASTSASAETKRTEGNGIHTTTDKVVDAEKGLSGQKTTNKPGDPEEKVTNGTKEATSDKPAVEPVKDETSGPGPQTTEGKPVDPVKKGMNGTGPTTTADKPVDPVKEETSGPGPQTTEDKPVDPVKEEATGPGPQTTEDKPVDPVKEEATGAGPQTTEDKPVDHVKEETSGPKTTEDKHVGPAEEGQSGTGPETDTGDKSLELSEEKVLSTLLTSTVSSQAPDNFEEHRDYDPVSQEEQTEDGRPVKTYSNKDEEDEEEGSGHFMAYFIIAVILIVAGYLVYHNKQKVIAIFIEGKRSSKRRPNGKEYSRLKTTVDEAMPSLDKSSSSQNYVY